MEKDFNDVVKITANETLNKVRADYRDYFEIFNNYMTQLFEHRLKETKIETLKELSSCIIRIINDIVELAKIVANRIEFNNIQEANNNFIDLAGTIYNVKARYLRLIEHSFDKDLDKIHSDFESCRDTLNNDIINKYNLAHPTRPLLSLSEAHDIHLKYESKI